MASELYLSVKQSSGLTQGLTMLGILAVIVATLGVCGSVRGSPKCLYCYAVSSMGMLVVVGLQTCYSRLASLSFGLLYGHWRQAARGYVLVNVSYSPLLLTQENLSAIHHHRHAQLQRAKS